MIRDCREGRAEGWSYFVAQYVPVMRGLLAHYFPGQAGGELLERALGKLRESGSSGLFQSLDPAPERAFVAELRQYMLRAAEGDGTRGAPAVTIEIEPLGAALEPFTLTEKLVVWFETMLYGEGDTGRMLRMSGETAGKIRGRAGDAIRGQVDRWSSTLLADNGRALGQAAGALAGGDCPAAKVFFDVIDGRMTWRGREEMERHVKNCWYCIDHYCRLLEVTDVLRGAKPLPEAEAAEYRGRLGIAAPKRGFWRS